MSEALKVHGNVDNEELGPWGGKGLVVGYVDAVNGDGAQEVSGVVPTRHELLELAKYWAKIAVDHEWYFFCTGQTGSTEWRETAYAHNRIGRIADLLGEEAVGLAVEEAYHEFARDLDATDWAIFRNGSEEERSARHAKLIEEYHESGGE